MSYTELTLLAFWCSKRPENINISLLSSTLTRSHWRTCWLWTQREVRSETVTIKKHFWAKTKIFMEPQNMLELYQLKWYHVSHASHWICDPCSRGKRLILSGRTSIYCLDISLKTPEIPVLWWHCRKPITLMIIIVFMKDYWLMQAGSIHRSITNIFSLL